ncbi:MAG: FecR domain-containing protein [Polyangiaceae bacterium]
MNAPRFAKLSASLLAQHTHLQMPEADSIAPPPMIDIESRARAISAIERAIREKARKKNRIRWIAGGLAIAASIAAIALGKSFTHTQQAVLATNAAPGTEISLALAHATGDVSIASQNGTTAGIDGANLAAGSHVVTKSGGHAVLALSTGTRLAVDESSDFSIVEEDATQVFALAQGSMRADVAKLKPGQRFIIRTSDSEVEVHGTSFTVSVAPADATCGGGTVTRVVVFEGVVTVRHDGVEARVPKGS